MKRCRERGGALAPSEPEPSVADAHAALAKARRSLRSLAPRWAPRELPGPLTAGWTRSSGGLEGLADEAGRDLDRLVGWVAALPAETRLDTLASIGLPPTPELVTTLLDHGEAGVAQGPSVACASLALAMEVTELLVVEGRDCRLLFDLLAKVWADLAEDQCEADQLVEAELCVGVAQALADLGGGIPEVAGKIGICRAQVHWQRAEIEAALVELDAALLFCRRGRNEALLGTALFLKGLALATAGRPAAARGCLEEGHQLLVASGQVEVGPLAERALETLDELF